MTETLNDAHGSLDEQARGDPGATSRQAGRRQTADTGGLDPDQLAHLVETHHGRAVALARRILRDPDDAADAVQDAWTRAVRALRSDATAVRDPDRFGSWFLKIVSNVAIDRHRQRRRDGRESLEEIAWEPCARDADLPWVAAERRERRADVLRALVTLTDAQRAALILREYHGESYAEIGGRLRLSEGATTMLLARARQAFRRAYTRVTAS